MLDREIEAAKALIEAFDPLGAQVFFTTVRYDEPDMRDAVIWRYKQKGLMTLAATAGGAEVDSRLAQNRPV